MIVASEIVSRVQQVGLDAQPDTDYYSVNNEIIPAIDSAVKWVTSVVQKARSNNKKTDEVVAELQLCYIWRTNIQSRITINVSQVWTIDAVAPLPATVSNGGAIPPNPPDQFACVLRSDLNFGSSNYFAKRKTIEEVDRNNPMSAGYMPPSIASSALVEGSNLNLDFGYIPSYKYDQNLLNAQAPFIEIVPSIPQKLCALFFTEIPAKVVATTDVIKYPAPLFNMIYEKTLQFLSYSQGDGTTIWEVTDDDISMLLNSIS